jgi:hypothetical protein
MSCVCALLYWLPYDQHQMTELECDQCGKTFKVEIEHSRIVVMQRTLRKDEMHKRDRVTEVDVGGARMLLPEDTEWHLRYGDAERIRFVAAEIISCYSYLIRECTAREATRRLRLLRKAYAQRRSLGRGPM